MMAHAEQAIDRFLVEGIDQEALLVDEIERRVRAARQYVMERFTSELARDPE